MNASDASTFAPFIITYPSNQRLDAAFGIQYSKYCGSTPSGFTDDYWAGAQKTCADLGMKLPTAEEFVSLHNNPNWTEKPTSGTFWTTLENTRHCASFIDFSNSGDVDYESKFDRHNLLCIGN